MSAAADVRNGFVSAFDPEAGLGMIVDGQGDRWMFHCTKIVDGSRNIAADTAVEFRIGPGGPGRWEAYSVRPVEQTDVTAPAIG